jgi:dTDP-4-amino-4,6-dideoxygalactose transaminase
MAYTIPYYSLETIHQDMKSELISIFNAVLDENWFVLGKYLQQFEENFADFIGVKYAIGVGNGLDGLKIAIKSLGLTQNDEILIPALTFSASVLAALETQVRPILVDIDPGNYLIDPHQIERNISAHSRAIMPVHLYGNPCEMDPIMQLAEEARLFVIEDYAQSVGALYREKPTGSIGTINATSFYPVKPLGGLGDGGMITTNDPVLRDQCIKLRNYGYGNKYQLETAGYNSRLDEIQAAFLMLKLRHIEKWHRERKEIADRYFQNLSGNEQVIMTESAESSRPAYHIFPIRIQPRDELKYFLEKKGIQTQIHYPIPPHLQPGLKYLGYEKGDFPATEQFCQTELSLPIYPGLTLQQVDMICENILSFLKDNKSSSGN